MSGGLPMDTELNLNKMGLLIEVVDLTKRFGNKTILESLHFAIYEQQALAIIGTNGSGKSTLLRMLAGISSQTSGTIQYTKGQSRLNIGYVPERFARLRFTPTEYLTYMGSMQGLTKAYLHKRIPELLQFCHLEQKGSTRIEYFSKGMLQKVSIMQAILSKPDLLILDEPLSGLDILAQKDLSHLLSELKQLGMSIVFSCHEAELLDRVADRIILLENGLIVEDSLVTKIAASKVWIEVEGLDDLKIKQIAELDGVIRYELLSSVMGARYNINVFSASSDAVLREVLSIQGSIISLNRR
jgi:ABC-2 type transport system ATP-binding protein